MKILIGKDICISVFIAALFTAAKIWAQPKSIHKWIVKEDVVCIYGDIYIYTTYMYVVYILYPYIYNTI